MESPTPVSSTIQAVITSNPVANFTDMKDIVDKDNPDYHIFQAIPAVLETENVTAPNLTIFTKHLPLNGIVELLPGEQFKKFVLYSVITINNYSLTQDLYEQGTKLSRVDANGTSKKELLRIK